MKEKYESTKRFVKDYLFSKDVSEQEKRYRYEHALLALLHELLQKIESLQTYSLASDTATALFYDALQKQHQFYSAMKEQYLRTF